MGESFQALATAQGEEFVRECVLALTRAGFEVIGERIDLVDTGCEVDLLARGMTGIVFYVECKGSFMRRPGCEELFLVALWPVDCSDDEAGYRDWETTRSTETT